MKLLRPLAGEVGDVLAFDTRTGEVRAEIEDVVVPPAPFIPRIVARWWFAGTLGGGGLGPFRVVMPDAQVAQLSGVPGVVSYNGEGIEFLSNGRYRVRYFPTIQLTDSGGTAPGLALLPLLTTVAPNVPTLWSEVGVVTVGRAPGPSGVFPLAAVVPVETVGDFAIGDHLQLWAETSNPAGGGYSGYGPGFVFEVEQWA